MSVKSSVREVAGEVSAQSSNPMNRTRVIYNRSADLLPILRGNLRWRGVKGLKDIKTSISSTHKIKSIVRLHPSEVELGGFIEIV